MFLPCYMQINGFSIEHIYKNSSQGHISQPAWVYQQMELCPIAHNCYRGHIHLSFTILNLNEGVILSNKNTAPLPNLVLNCTVYTIELNTNVSL